MRSLISLIMNIFWIMIFLIFKGIRVLYFQTSRYFHKIIPFNRPCGDINLFFPNIDWILTINCQVDAFFFIFRYA